MSDPIERIEHAGFRISIYRDEDCETPDRWGTTDLFLAARHRQFCVEGDPVRDPADAICSYDCDEEHEHTAACPKEGSIKPDIAASYHVFGLYAYIHSGVSLSLGAHWAEDDGWDTSQVGLVFASRSEWPDAAEAEKAAESLVKEWNDCLSGNVYGYVIEAARRYRKVYLDSSGEATEETEGTEWENVDSCWRFIGDSDYCRAEAKAVAETMAAAAKED